MAFEIDEMLVSTVNPIIGGGPHVLLFLINAFLIKKYHLSHDSMPEHSPGRSLV